MARRSQVGSERPKRHDERDESRRPVERSAAPATRQQKLKSRIMYIESKSGRLIGPARIGRVQFSKTGKTLYYGGREFQSLKGRGFKTNYRDVETGDEYWISGCKKDGSDRLYGEPLPVAIDEDVRDEYWTNIRGTRPK